RTRGNRSILHSPQSGLWSSEPGFVVRRFARANWRCSHSVSCTEFWLHCLAHPYTFRSTMGWPHKFACTSYRERLHLPLFPLLMCVSLSPGVHASTTLVPALA